MKIYTKTGDDGTTFMPKIGRVKKHDLCIKVQGELDELNAWCGLIAQKYTSWASNLELIQGDLMEIGAQLARKEQRLGQNRIDFLENTINTIDAKLSPLANFILPSYPAEIHIARAVCRRTERTFSEYGEGLDADYLNLILPYLNRLSDFLFTLARFISQNDKIWHSNFQENSVKQNLNTSVDQTTNNIKNP